MQQYQPSKVSQWTGSLVNGMLLRIIATRGIDEDSIRAWSGWRCMA